MIQFFTKKMRNKKGFTLIELVVVIAILGILAAVMIPRFSGFTDKAQGSAALVHAKQFATAYDSLVAEGKTWATGTGTMSTTTFYTADVLTLAGLTSDHGTVSNVDANGTFEWTAAATQGGKKAGRTNTEAVTIKP